MFLQTKAKIGRLEYDIVWSYDTKVLDEYRKTEAGTIIVGKYFRIRIILGRDYLVFR